MAKPDESPSRLAPYGEFQGDFMRNGRLTVQATVQAASVSGFLFCGLLAASAPAARADVYHAVSQGETLASVAAKYRVSVGDLRVANGLKGEDNIPLPAMLLRVPGIQEGAAPALAGLTNAATPAISQSTAQAATKSGGSSLGGAAATGNGFIARTLSETVRAGDSWDSIAARYVAAGYDVSVNSLRNRNNGIALVAGTTVVVPLDKTNYSTPAYTAATPGAAQRISTMARAFPGVATPTISTVAQKTPPIITPNAAPRSLGDGVYASGEANLPVAKDITPTQAPVFGAGSRGALASRGGYGQLARTAMGGGVQILTPGQDAPAPQRGIIGDVSDTVSQPVVTGAGMARVADVALAGAAIRRIPEPSAAMLFQCPQGSQLAVLSSKGAWSAVLMSDHSTGWVPTKYLRMTDQTIDVTQQLRPTQGPGGDAVYNVGSYSTRSKTVAQALRWLGTRYVYGGTGRRGIDCSAMIQNSFASCGIKLPRTAATQAKVGIPVSPENLQPGDRLYFSASGTRIDHTGLYMGDGLFVHASGSGRKVMVSKLFQGRNWNIFVGARR